MKKFTVRAADFMERGGKTFFVIFGVVFVAAAIVGLAAGIRGFEDGGPDRYLQLIAPLIFGIMAAVVFPKLWRGFRPLDSVLLPGEILVDQPPRQFVRYSMILQYKLQLGRIILTDRRVMFAASPFSSPTMPFDKMWLPGRGEGKAAVWVKHEGLRVFFDYGMTHFSFEVADEASLGKWKVAFRVA